MDLNFRLTDLAAAHPELYWDSMIAAAVSVLEANSLDPRDGISLSLEGIMEFHVGHVRLIVDTEDVPRGEVARVERTYEPSRLVELAAIAMAGVSLYHIGDHVISDVALARTGADYLVDEGRYLLEVAGRSQRSEANRAWNERWSRLQQRADRGFYLFVVEFESFSARLGFGGPA